MPEMKESASNNATPEGGITSQEIRKWERVLEEDAKIFLYRLSDEKTTKQEQYNEKPW